MPVVWAPANGDKAVHANMAEEEDALEGIQSCKAQAAHWGLGTTARSFGLARRHGLYSHFNFTSTSPQLHLNSNHATRHLHDSILIN